MEYKAGDQVVHCVHGPGSVLRIEEKVLSGQSALYYVVQVRELLVWVPVGEISAHNLRRLTPAEEFETLFDVLRSPAEPLSQDRLERKTQLTEKMRAGKLESICQVVRDLSYCRRAKKLSDNEASLLERAQSLLLGEWGLSLAIPTPQAEKKLDQLLGESFQNSRVSA